RSSRGGRGHDGARAQATRDGLEPEVVRAEVMAPLRYAVGLVDDEEADVDAAEAVEEPGRAEALRSDVEEAKLAGDGPLDRGPVVLAGLLSVDERNAVAGATRAKAVNLVLHQGDERRDDDGQVLAHERRKLVAERLARAGGHDDERVAPLERRPHGLLLPGPEGTEAEVVVEGRAQVHRSGDPSGGIGGVGGA